MLRKAMGTYPAGIQFTEIRLVKLISSEVPHQFSINLCEVTFDKGEIIEVHPIEFDLSVTDLDSTDTSELLNLWISKLKGNLTYWVECAEQAYSKPLLEVKTRLRIE